MELYLEVVCDFQFLVKEMNYGAKYAAVVYFVTLTVCTQAVQKLKLTKVAKVERMHTDKTRSLAIAKRPCDCCIILKTGSYTKAI